VEKLFDWKSHGRGRLANRVTKQDADVLTSGDQMILDGLTPQSPPPRSLKSMIVAGISKTTLQQVLPPLSIATGAPALALVSGLIEFRLPVKALNAAATFGFGALGA